MIATTAELLLRRAADDHPALLFEDSSWTWREFVAESGRRAAWLTREYADAEPLHVGVLMENTPEYLFWLGACILSGGTLVGVNTTRRGTELADDIAGTDLALLLVDEASAPTIEGVDLHVPVVLITDPSYLSGLGAHDATPFEPTPAALDPATRLMLLFTSGSTGAPKPVICTTGRFAYLCQATAIPLTHDDVAYNAMPLFHGNALMAAWAPCLNHGATYALRRRFSASGFRTDVQRFGATFFNYVGRSLAYVLAQPEHQDERDNRLRFGFGTEASMRDRAEFQRRYGAALFESYGSSEGTIAIVRTPDTPERALGKPVGDQVVEVVGEDGEVCPPAELGAGGELLNPDAAIGELVGRGAAGRFEGYYGNATAEQERLRGADYFTGDMGYRDADGFFYFAGRTADRLRVDSENLASAPIEELLLRQPGVRAAAVYPVPDPHTGDAVMAALEVDSSFTIDDFAERLAADPDLGTKSTPRFVRVCETLPVTATRKVDKAGLRRARWSADGVYERQLNSYVTVDAERRSDLDVEFADQREGSSTL